MSGHSRFENQVFISYAHIDNASLSGTKEGWIDALHDRLKKRLAMLLGKELEIWRDSKLTGHDIFNETILFKLSQSALLLSVLSPRYIQSNPCRTELTDFLRVAVENGGVRFRDKHRVLKVVKTYVPMEQHPDELKDLLGYEFYERDAASGRVREFDYEVLPQKDKRYFDKLEDLAQDIASFFADSSKPSEQATTVYLAETTSDLQEERSRIKRELQQYGHIVLPDKPLPLDAPTLQNEVREYLHRSRLSVHCIGAHYGVIPEGESERSVVQIQEELAAEQASSNGASSNGFSRLVWMPPGLQAKDARQQSFLAALQANLLQVKLEELKTIIHDKLSRHGSLQLGEISTSSQPSIYLVCDSQDLDAIGPLQKYLLAQGYEAILPLFDGHAEEILEDRKQNLLICDAVLVFHGSASEAWLKAQLRELIKLQGLERQKPLLAKAFYLAGPKSPAKERFNTIVAHMIRNYGGFDSQVLAPFLAQLPRSKAAGQ
jgi:hypothetical protein